MCKCYPSNFTMQKAEYLYTQIGAQAVNYTKLQYVRTCLICCVKLTFVRYRGSMYNPVKYLRWSVLRK